MYTQCPECLTIFEIDEDALQASLGIVHCGQCRKRFDALRTLSDTLPAAPHAALPKRGSSKRAPTLTTTIPSSTFELAGHQRSPPSGTSMPAPESGTTEWPWEPASGAAQPAAIVRMQASDRTDDWFADLETELTSSLLAAATGSPLDAAGEGNTWQVSDLSVQTGFANPGIPVTFAGPEPDGVDRSVTRETNVPRQIEPAPQADGEAPASSGQCATTTTVPADDWLSSTEHPEIGRAQTASAHFQESGPFADVTAPHRPGAAADDWPGADEITLSGSELLPTEPDAALQTTLSLPPGAAESDTMGAPAAVTAEPEPVESNVAVPSAPMYVRPLRRGAAAAGAAWALGCLLLALTLAAQLAWVNRVELFRNPATRPWVARVCLDVPCRLPPVKDLAKLELLSRDIRPDPHAAGALTITATMRNNATFRQPWPVVAVELKDLDSNPVAMRRFRPSEYMPDPTRRAAGIAAGATAAVAFEVADPGRNAVSFQFGFE